ncbi:hypothetical protein EsDP_00004690 [Epichloe bromicola]|uniref:Uncharacterized protein n=1 Tax=Epichloe bromicola TaxID=79588 RepID=A0ABQ0CSG0_9HYPO
MESSSSRARLRRTLGYPDFSSSPSTLDEQEQEALINHLSAQNALQNTLFSRLLLALPLAATLPYVALLAHDPGRAIVAVPSLTSLLSTAYLLHSLPPGVTGIAPLDARTGASGRRPQRGFPNRHRDRDKSPLETYLPYLNAGLVLILALTGLATGRGAPGSGSGSFAWIATGNLPGVVYAIVLLAKVVMGGVDPERELSALKYGYRGA